MDSHRLLGYQPIFAQIPDLLTQVSVGDFIDLVGIQPDLLAAAQHTGGRVLLKPEHNHHCARFVSLRVTPGGTQGFLLVLCLGVTPPSAWETIHGARDSNGLTVYKVTVLSPVLTLWPLYYSFTLESYTCSHSIRHPSKL